ncbi:Beta-1-syntrophin [Heterocephalus glaber]|uniref:Beta-1-syntrophin n=1 Tax=Heterocephalus glaber TaxID=10181 RepID=G5C9Q6_HETGA|nr:Beta-1-syntrophin [Heterocephalus glaber]
MSQIHGTRALIIALCPLSWLWAVCGEEDSVDEVKYMREATPYVKKGSPVSEIGWETPPPESPRLGGGSSDPQSSQAFCFHPDQKSIPLRMCYVTRSLALADPENRVEDFIPLQLHTGQPSKPHTSWLPPLFQDLGRCPAAHQELPGRLLAINTLTLAPRNCCLVQFEIHSPDTKHTVALRSKDSATAQAWFSAIHANVSDLLPSVISEVREQLGKVGLVGGHEIRHLGWLAEKVPGDSGRQWKPALVVLTEKDLLVYDSMPRRKEAWLSPAHSYPLLATRLVHSGPGKGSPQAGLELSFATRTGTKQGIETHLFRAEVSKDLSQWTRSIVQGCHNSAELIAEVTTACTYKNQECRLTVHYENGFTVTTEPQEGASPKTIIQSPYEKLKMSSDDGTRMLYLDFGGKEGEIQLDLHSCPKPIVFIIHSFLSAKIARLGLVA